MAGPINELQRTKAIPLFLVTIVIGMSILVLLPSRSWAQSEQSGAVLIVVLDVSGSMLEGAGNGQTKIEVAKAALASLLADIPDGASIGLRVYGSQLAPGPDGSEVRRRNCESDTELLVPVSQLDRAALGAAVDQLQALGDTPISLALNEAAGDIPDGSLGTIVLISDGRDECFPFGFGADPSETAAELFEEGIRVRKIETVGFQVEDDPAAVQELRDIAEAGNGSFTSVESPDELAEKIRPIFAGALQIADQLGGDPVVGGDGIESAPMLKPGRYTDTLTPGEPKYYKVAVRQNVPLSITATVFDLPARPGTSVRVEVLPEDLNDGSVDLAAPEIAVLRDEAGLDRTGADSARLERSWSWTGGSPVWDQFYRVAIDGEDALAQEYVVEIDYELPVYSNSAECPPGSECDFQRLVTEEQEQISSVETAIAEVQSAAGPDQLRRLEADSAELDGAINMAEAELSNAQSERDSRRVQGLLGLVATIALGAVAAGGLGLIVASKRQRGSAL